LPKKLFSDVNAFWVVEKINDYAGVNREKQKSEKNSTKASSAKRQGPPM
jgi:hypothetical protein